MQLFFDAWPRRKPFDERGHLTSNKGTLKQALAGRDTENNIIHSLTLAMFDCLAFCDFADVCLVAKSLFRGDKFGAEHT